MFCKPLVPLPPCLRPLLCLASHPISQKSVPPQLLPVIPDLLEIVYQRPYACQMLGLMATVQNITLNQKRRVVECPYTLRI